MPLYNWHRYYAPTVGRYLRAELVGLDIGINLFAYTINNPIEYSDSTGLEVNYKVSTVGAGVLVGVCMG